MPIDAGKVEWDAPEAAPDSSQVKWDPAPALPPADPRNPQSHTKTEDPHQSIAQMLYPEIDFDVGLPTLDRVNLSRADNFKEKKKYLEKVYGKDAVSVEPDPYGQQSMLVVTQDGKKIAAEGGSGFGGFAADIASAIPELTSMGAGALEGSELGPLGMIGGAAIGGLFGKTVSEGEKAAEGWYSKTPREAMEAATDATISGAGGEVLGGLTQKTISRILRGPLPNLITQTTPEGSALTDRLLTGGARPFAQSTMPGAKRFQMIEAVGSKISGPVRSQNAANEEYVAGRLRQVLRDSGVPEGQIEPTLRELQRGESTIPTEQIGEHVKTRVQAHVEMLEANVEGRLKDVNAELDSQLAHLDQLTGRYRTGDLGVDVARGIQQARKDFGTSMSKIYSKVDQIVGDQPLVPTELIRKEAARMAKRLPRSSTPAVTGEMANLPGATPAEPDDAALFRELGIDLPHSPDGKISFADAQRLRTILREKSDQGNLVRGVTAGEMDRLAATVDYAIQSTAADPVAGPAVRLLNQADQLYAQGIRRFRDATVKQLVKNLEAGLPPDPERIAQQIIQPGQTARVKEVRKLVGDEVWKRVAGADYARMVQGSINETGQIDGARWLAQIKARGGLMETVYGDKVAAQIQELARAVAVRDGALPVEALSPSRISQTLQALKSAEESQDRFLSESYLSVLRDPRRNPTAVYRWLTRPANGAALREAAGLLTPDQLGQLRQSALKELLGNAKLTYADKQSADALTEALSKYSPEQQAVLFPNGQADDLNLLGKEITAVMRNLSDESKASMAAGAILNLPFAARIPIQVWYGIEQTILSQPQVIRYLALGLRQPAGPARNVAREMVTNLVKFGAIAPTQGSNEGAPQSESGDTENAAVAGAGGGP